MAGTNGYTAQQFIIAIGDSGGVVSTIARRVGCDWNTAKKYIDTYPTVAQALRAEKESIKDMAEGVVMTNIKLAQLAQEETGEQQNSGDAKWYLSKMAKDRGYVDNLQLEGNEQKPIVVKVLKGVSMDDL